MVSLALVLGACGGDEAKSGDASEAKAKLPPVDAKAVKDAVTALSELDADQHAVFAAAALAELEKSRLPASLVEGLDALKSVSPDQRALVLARIIEKNIQLLNEACDADAIELMKKLATVNVDTRHDLVWKTCKFERHGLVTAANTTGSEPIATMVAHMAYVHLAAGGPVSGDEKALLTTLAKTASAL